MTEILKAIVLGIVEGITEWIPISSTGHMILVDEFMHLNVSDDFLTMFLVVIQLGAIMAVVVSFWKKLWPFSAKEPHVKMDSIMTWLKVALACIPAAVIGFFLDDWADEHLYKPVVVGAALIAFGIWFLVIENKEKTAKVNSVEELSFKQALIIGCFQLFAFIPGTSRSGSTIIGGLSIGTSRSAAAEFTFWLAIPIMAGASFLKLIKFGRAMVAMEWAVLLAGSITAFIVSLVCIKFFMKFVKTHSFKAFGWYRIILGAVVLAYFLFF